MTKLKLIFILFLAFHLNTSFAQKKKKDKSENNGKEQTNTKVSEDSRIKAERLFFDGQKEKLIGNIEQAYNNFNQSVKINPELDASYYEMAQLQQLAGDYESAQKSMEEALKISPKNNWYEQYYGDILASQYKYADAANVFNKLKKENPSNLEYHYQEAYYLILSNDLKGAIVVYDEVEKQIGVQPDASLQKYKIYSRLNKETEAVNELEKLIKAFPDELEFQNSLAEFYVINLQEEKAVPIFEKILEIDPYNITALTSLSDYYKKIGNDAKALEYSQKAFGNPEISIDTKIKVLYNYIQYYEQKKESINEAFALSDILMATHPKEAKAYAIAGDLRNLENQQEEALKLYKKALDYQKDIFTVWQQVFFINSDLKKFDDLITITNEAKEFFPNQALVYFFNGVGYQQTKDNTNAEKAYSKGLKMAGDNPLLKAQIYSNLGDVYNDLKNYKESDASFDKALEINPDNAYVLNNYSYYLSLRGEKLDKAAEMSLHSNELEPNNSSFLDTYAWVLYKNNKFKEAQEWQQKAIDAVEEPSATLLEHMGDILFKLGKESEAVEYWKQAAEKDGGSDFLPQKITEKKLYE